MSEYKIDFDIPAMKKDQLKEFKPNILRAVVILVSAVLTSFVAIRFFAPLLILAGVLFAVFLYLTVLLVIGGYRYNRYAKKHSVDLVTITSDTIKVDGDVYKRGNEDLSFRIERGMKFDRFNLTGCLLTVRNKREGSKNVYWIGPKEHFDTKFKRDMLYDAVFEDAVNCLYVSDVPESEEKDTKKEINIDFPYWRTRLRHTAVTLLFFAASAATFIAWKNNDFHYNYHYGSAGPIVGIIGGIVIGVLYFCTPYVNSRAHIRKVKVDGKGMIVNDDMIFFDEGCRVRVIRGNGSPGKGSHIYIEAGNYVYWAGFANDPDCEFAVGCLRNAVYRYYPAALMEDKLNEGLFG